MYIVAFIYITFSNLHLQSCGRAQTQASSLQKCISPALLGLAWYPFNYFKKMCQFSVDYF